MPPNRRRRLFDDRVDEVEVPINSSDTALS
jgi:hypothetical protein